MTGTRRPTGAAISMPCDSITKNGTVIYRFGSTAVRDDGDKLTVSRGATGEGLQAALRMATQRYGPLLRVGGTAAFKEDVVQAAVDARLAVRFDDVRLEFRRQTMLRQACGQINKVPLAKYVHRRFSAPGRPTGDGSTVTATTTWMKRGNGRHRSGP